MRVLFLASRELTGPMTGRKQVLRTILESLHLNECETVVATFNGEEQEQERGLKPWGVTRVKRLHRPRLTHLATALPWRFLRGSMSANECLYYAEKNLAILRRLVDEERIDFVVCDMLRLAPYAAQLNRPWHLDLDDLLSQRYTNLAQGAKAGTEKTDQLLGYYGQMLPRPALRCSLWLAQQLLPLEARTIAARELRWSREATSVSLVSPHEAERFSQTLGRPVHCLPMRAQFPADDFVAPPVESSLVFLGGLDYQPNLDAVRYYRDRIRPCLIEAGLAHVELVVVGKTTDAARQELAMPGIRLAGYAENLATEVCRHAIFLAPITHGTGIKTKVLDALGHGLPLVSTAKGIEGMGAEHGVHCLVADEPSEMARHIKALLENPTLARQLALAGQEHVRAHFSLHVIAARWREILKGAAIKSTSEESTQRAEFVAAR